MFAIALHDAAKKSCSSFATISESSRSITQSPIGILVWGSEIKSILASGLVGRELDVDAIGQFMSWEYIPGPQTLFRPVTKLGAGEVLELDLETGAITHRTYWDVPVDELPNGFSIAD
jgi:asparagine synthase (glutamine-hydrolysing)